MGDGDSAEQLGAHMEGAGQAGTAKVIHVNYITAAIDPVYFPQQDVIGDIADSIGG